MTSTQATDLVDLDGERPAPDAPAADQRADPLDWLMRRDVARFLRIIDVA